MEYEVHMKNWHFRALGIFLAFVIAGIFIAISINSHTRKIDEKQYDILCFGDSIFGEVRDSTSIPEVLASLTKKRVMNAGIGGTLASYSNKEYRSDAPKDALSLVALTKAIKTNDFIVQKSELARNQITFPYFEEVIMELQLIDYKKTDVIYIEQGVNDYMAGVPLENKEEPLDTYTYAGALRTAIENLKIACPNATIILCTPTYMVLFDQNGTYQTCEEMDFGGGTLPEYAEIVRKVAAEYQLPLLDNYKDLGIRERTVMLYTLDGLHLASWAREKMAQQMYLQWKTLKKP